MIGATARYGIDLLWPRATGGFPWAILVVNVSGCALIGVLIVVIVEIRFAHRLARPFLATGVLGGFTTFSTYAVEVQRLTAEGSLAVALVYLVLTPSAALASVWGGTVFARRALRK